MNYFIASIILGLSCLAQAKLQVVTTTTTMKVLVQEVGKTHVEVYSLTNSSQDPHFVEPKPSFMVKLRKADLLVAVGLDLEVGWLGSVQRGAKNPALLDDQSGFFVAGNFIDALEIPQGKVDRAQGDVHPQGNPHFHQDPLRVAKVVRALAERLSTLDPQHREDYLSNANAFTQSIEKKMISWQERIRKSKVKKVVTYHKSFVYFLDRFDIEPVATIEPKPGIPPTAKHIIELMSIMKTQKVNCILNEDYFEITAATRLKKTTGASIQVLPVEAKTNYIDHIESLVRAIDKCGNLGV